MAQRPDDLPGDRQRPHPEELHLLRIMASVGEYQAELITENVREGLERARERRGGTMPVRGPSFTPDQRKNAEELARKTDFSAARIAEMVGVSRATLYRHVDITAIRAGKAS
jgi:DNA invertase Pin-like site-specific DNA recombinase